MRTRVMIAVLTLIGVAGLFLAGLAIGRSTAPPSPAVNRLALAPAGADCWELLKNATRVYMDGCDGGPGPSPTTPPTAPPATPTRGRGTATPGATGTPPPTATAGPATATPTGQPPGHDLTAWHPAGVNYHHHGADPMTAHPAIAEWLETDEWGPFFAAVGHPWLSSPTENIIKHQGFTNLDEHDTGCGNSRQDPENCILAYLYQVHSFPVASEWLARVHSYKIVILVCEEEGEGPCDIVAFGGHQDYGERHAAYKRDVCALGDNPEYDEGDTANQAPYLANAGREGPNPNLFPRFRFWQSLTNPSIHYAFDPVPNRLLQSAWNDMPWSTASIDPMLCLNPEHDYFPCPDNSCIQNGTRYQVFDLRVFIEDFPRPFRGYVDVYGNPAPDCTAIGPTCAPIYIGPNVPAGNAMLLRQVDHGNPDAAPILIYGEGADLRPPGTYPLAAPAAEPVVEPYP